MVQEKLVKLICDQFDVDPEELTSDGNLREIINADSLDLVDLVMSIEDEFGIDQITDDEANNIYSLADLVALVEKKLG